MYHPASRRWLVLSIVGLAALATRPGLGQVEQYGGHSYYLTDAFVSYQTGRVQAAAVGGYLTAITDAAENDWIDATFPAAWIGLTDEEIEGVFVWDSGEPFDYENWDSIHPLGQPLRNYVHVGSNGTWRTTRSDLPPNDPILPGVIETATPLGPTVENLTCSLTPEVATLTWTLPAESFESIDVYRGTALVATLPGTATTYDEFPVPGDHVYWLHPQGASVVARPVTCKGSPADHRIWISGSEVTTSSPTQISVRLDAAERLAGFSYALCHDPAVLDLVDVQDGTLSQFVEPDYGRVDFHQVDIFPDGFTVGVVLFGAGVPWIPVTVGLNPDNAFYLATSPVGTTTELEFCEIGFPAIVSTMVVTKTGLTLTPVIEGATLEVVAGFRRGDDNGDGFIDLADPVSTLEFLFYGGPDSCRDARDTNDDGAVNLADPIYGLMYQFYGGSQPPAPTTECGVDPTEDGLDCSTSPSCG